MPWTMNTEQLVLGTKGRLVSSGSNINSESNSNDADTSIIFKGVGTDTRENLEQKIFFALKGDRYDAHDYLEAAITAGASAVVVHDLRKVPAHLNK